jgi:hypothetical protein
MRVCSLTRLVRIVWRLNSTLLLPLSGLESAFPAAVVITLSTHWLAEGMRGGMVNGCAVEF